MNRANHSASEEGPESSQMLSLLIRAMLEKEVIQFQPYSWCFGMVDMFVMSELFAEKEYVLSVHEDDWNGGPAKCVEKEPTKTVAEGKIKLISLTRP